MASEGLFVYHLILLIINLGCCVIIILPYFFHPKIRKFPGTLIFYSSWALLFGLIPYIINAYLLTHSNGERLIDSKGLSLTTAFQVSFNLLWMIYIATLSLNLTFLIAFPFYSTRKAMKYIHGIIAVVYVVFWIQVFIANDNSFHSPYSHQTQHAISKFNLTAISTCMGVTVLTLFYNYFAVYRKWLHSRFKKFVVRNARYSVVYLGYLFVLLMTTLKMLGDFGDADDDNLTIVTITATIQMFFIALMSAIRIYDPQIRSLYSQFLKSFFRCRVMKGQIFSSQDISMIQYEEMCENFENLERDNVVDRSVFTSRKPSKLSDTQIGISMMMRDPLFEVSTISEDDYSCLQTSRNFYVTLVSIIAGLHREEVSPRRVIQSPHLEMKLSESDVGQWLDMQMFHCFRVKLKIYYPERFENLRATCGINFDQLRRSLDPLSNVSSLRSAKEGAGKSGSYFLFTSDRKFILKVVTQRELEGFLRLNREADRYPFDDSNTYFKFLEDPTQSLLAKVLGIYRIRHAFFGAKVYVLLMENIQTPLGMYSGLKRTYDLKGSTFDRSTLGKAPTAVISQLCFEDKVLKDNDYLMIEKHIYLPNEDRDKLFTAIQRDLDFLEHYDLMDYSLLLTFRVEDEGDTSRSSNIHQRPHRIYRGYNLEGKNITISFGIIDYFQIYDSGKKIETYVKSALPGASIATISSLAPDDYAKRFLDFMKSGIVNITDFDTSLVDDSR